jgi:two-component system invasion response regulator UvrY
MIRLLIIDDHAIVRAGVRRLLAPEPDIECLEADSGEAALALVARAPVRIAVLDLNLPGLGGPALIRALIALRPDLCVLVFSTHTERIYVAKSLEAGARGYVSKNAAPEELARAVHAVLQGRTYIEADIAEELEEAEGDSDLRPLSSRELEIMRLLARGRSLTQIAEALGVAYKTVANTCTHIKEKLGAAHTADLIRISVDRGLV